MRRGCIEIDDLTPTSTRRILLLSPPMQTHIHSSSKPYPSGTGRRHLSDRLAGGASRTLRCRMRISKKDIARFWSKVDQSGGPDACWPWTKGRYQKGYGSFGVGGKNKGSHRVAYELVKGPIPAGLCVCHRCNNPRCCNPRHLATGTYAENSRYAVLCGRVASGDRHGSHKHPEAWARGEAHGQSKLTYSVVRQIRNLAKSGELHRVLGAMFGVNRTAIAKVVRRETWIRISKKVPS